MKRRFFMQTGAALLAAGGMARAAEARKPNFVFFLVDDLGTGDIGCFGSTFHETPNVDALCAQGMKFTQAYAACCVCSPSRAAILTGCYPGRLRLTDWIAGHKRPYAKLKVPDWQMYIDRSRTTIPMALKKGGYTSQFIGKWHLMPVDQLVLWPEHTPEKHGFDGNIAGREWGQPKGRGKYFYPFDMPNLEGKPGDFLTDDLTDQAVEYLGKTTDKPFLLYMAYYAVHEPVMCKPADEAYFRKKLAASPKGTYTQTNPKYAGLVKAMDDSVGRIVAKLKALGEYGNTIFIFTGDNGGLPPTSSGIFRGTKGTSFEGGDREPTFIVWPGAVKPGSQCAVPIIGTDYFPTMLEMAGLPLLPEQHKDGLSLVSLLKQTGTLGRDTLYWHYPHYHHTTPFGSILDQDWKLIEFFEDGKLMLFNLKNDPQEKHDLARQYPEKAQKLLAKMRAWRTSVDAQMPTANPNYDPAKENEKKASGKRKKGKRKKA